MERGKRCCTYFELGFCTTPRFLELAATASGAWPCYEKDVLLLDGSSARVAVCLTDDPRRAASRRRYEDYIVRAR